MKSGLYALLQLVHQEMKSRQKYKWQLQARPEQWPPDGDWRTWLILAGRGFGKTRTGAETIRLWVQEGRYGHIGLISSSMEEARSVMVEGESGLLAVHPKRDRPKFIAAKHQLLWPNGAVASLYGGKHRSDCVVHNLMGYGLMNWPNFAFLTFCGNKSNCVFG